MTASGMSKKRKIMLYFNFLEFANINMHGTSQSKSKVDYFSL